MVRLVFSNKKPGWKLSVECYHFVRGWNDNMYGVVAMEMDLYDYVMGILDLRKKLSFWWMWRKNRINFVGKNSDFF